MGILKRLLIILIFISVIVLGVISFLPMVIADIILWILSGKEWVTFSMADDLGLKLLGWYDGLP